MEGVDPFYLKIEEDYLSQLLNKLSLELTQTLRS